MTSFECRRVSKHFAGVQALKDANLHIDGNKTCGLVGANGSGKTTFSRICAGLIQRDSGEIWVDGARVHLQGPGDARGLGIVLAHQNLSLIPDLTVWQNICLGHEKTVAGLFLDNAAARVSAAKLLDDLVPNEIDLDGKVATLSPAQKQMVEIAKAISQDPRLLILDEPTAALEYNHVERLFQKVQDLKSRGVTVVFVSHRLWEIARICDVVFAFRNGETVGQVDFQKQERSERLIVPLVTGADVADLSVGKKPKNGSLHGSRLELQSVSVGKKLHHVSFSVRPGEILGIGGLSGQGQEELMTLLAGGVRPREGRILLDGVEIRHRHPRHALKKGICLVPGDRREGLFVNHNVFTNLVFPRISLRLAGFFLRSGRLARIVDDVIARTGLVPPRRGLVVKNLSGGNQQKVVFGRWLQFSPKVLLLNDPAKGIDILAKDQLYKLVHGLSHQGTAVVLYASSNEELIANCDRVLIMFEGSVTEEVTYDDISDKKLVTASLRVGGHT
jgi:ribose transport system ATP-binding protein